MVLLDIELMNTKMPDTALTGITEQLMVIEAYLRPFYIK